MTGPIAMSANKITGLGAPVDPNDAARKTDLGAGTFLALTDTPASYASQVGNLPIVNGAANALERKQLRHFRTVGTVLALECIGFVAVSM